MLNPQIQFISFQDKNNGWRRLGDVSRTFFAQYNFEVIMDENLQVAVKGREKPSFKFILVKDTGKMALKKPQGK